nr:acyl-CoA reductase [Flavobacteriales bacterium]
MNHQERKAAFIRLGEVLRAISKNPQESDWATAFNQAEAQNRWFTQENMALALRGIAFMLQAEKLDTWLSAYSDIPETGDKRVGLIMAGNIPLVGFHDLLCVLISGNTAVVKLSSQDEILPKKLVEALVE